MEQYASFRLLIGFDHMTELRDEAHDLGVVIGRMLFTLLAQQVVELGGDVILDQGEVVVVPGSLQCHEMLLGTAQEAFLVEPVRLSRQVVGTSRGGRRLERLRAGSRAA